MAQSEKPPIDNPITSAEEDVLERAGVAHDFARSIRRLNASEGLVVGVLGPWGHGKSSFINLMKEEFKADPSLVVVDFNPWMFSGSQQLVDFFFKEVAAELRLKGKDRFEKVADGLDEYGDVLSPLAMLPWVGAWWDRAFKAGRALIKWRNERRRGTRSLREKIADALRELDQPIVVVIDDIDRLTTEEIRDIFKLVRLTASFPNLIYLLAFDRARVEAALDESKVPGRAYLEKIVQLSFDLPAIPRDLLRSQVLSEMDRLLGDVEDLRFDADRWPDIYVELIEPLIGNMRDVTRLAISARPTMEALGGEIEGVDLLALESIRIFRPELFAEIQGMKVVLTGVSGVGSREDPTLRAQIDKILEVAGAEAQVVRDLISRIFPAAKRYTENTFYGSDSAGDWRRARRLAHVDFLSLYLERSAPSGVGAFRAAETAYTRLADPVAFDQFLGSIPPTDLEDSIAALEAYEHEYPIEGIAPGATALLNRIADIPKREARGLFDFNRPDLVVGRVVLRMLRMVDEESDREVLAKAIMGGLKSYSTRYDFLTLIGYKEGAGHQLITEDLANELEEALVDEILTKPPQEPAREWDLLRTLYFAAERSSREVSIPKPIDADFARALFSSAKSTNRAQSIDSRQVRTEDVLAWEPLLKVLGSEDMIREAVAALRAADGDSPLVLLIEKYLDGWRPKDFN